MLVTPLDCEPSWLYVTCDILVRSHYRNIFFRSISSVEELGRKIGSFIAKRWKKVLNSTPSIMVPTWTKHFKLTDKGFGDVLEISCRSQAHNLFARGLNLGNGNHRCSSELPLMLRHSQHPSFRFTATVTTPIVCVLVRRRAECRVLHSAFPFHLLSGNQLHTSHYHYKWWLNITRALPICFQYIRRRPGSILPTEANSRVPLQPLCLHVGSDSLVLRSYLHS